jgi:hypothetical protein
VPIDKEPKLTGIWGSFTSAKEGILTSELNLLRSGEEIVLSFKGGAISKLLDFVLGRT